MNDDEWLATLTDDQFDAVLADRRRAQDAAVRGNECGDTIAFANRRLNAAAGQAGPRIDRLRHQISSLERLTQ